MASNAQSPEILKLVRSTRGQRADMIYLERHSGSAASYAAVPVALQHGGARPLPVPAVPSTSQVVPPVP